MDPLLAGFLAANLALTTLLVVMVAVRKFRRDRRERRLRVRRDELRVALDVGGNDLDRVVRELCRRPSAAIDLAVVLGELADRGEVWSLAAIARSAVRCGLDEVLHRRLGARRPVTRGSAALVLGHLRTPDAVVAVRPLLDDRDGDVRLVAAGALARIRTGQAAAVLTDALARRTMPPERLIERLGAAWAAPTVLARLVGEQDAQVRCWLARALGLAGHRDAEPVLVELLRAADVEVRVSSARALASCGGPSCVPALLDVFGGDTWEVRAQIATSLGALGALGAVAALEGALGDRAWWVRANAATALAALHEPGVSALRRAAAGPDVYAAERAREALAAAGLATADERAA